MTVLEMIVILLNEMGEDKLSEQLLKKLYDNEMANVELVMDIDLLEPVVGIYGISNEFPSHISLIPMGDD